MARVGRFAGALLVDDGGEQILVGNPKEPCDLVSGELQAPWITRVPAKLEVRAPLLVVDGAGEPLARALSARLLIERNGSASERLWRLVTNGQTGEIDARWLLATPAHVWNVVRETLLKCS